MAINFRSNGQGRMGGVVVLLLRECLDCLELNDWDNRVKCLWVRFQGKPTRQISRWVSVIDAPRGRRNILQAAEKSLKITSTSSRGDFCSPVCWKYNGTERKQVPGESVKTTS